MDGFLIIDKPAGITSHDVVNQVRRILGTRRVGHAGTLDPFATGVLVVAVGWATRLLEVVGSDTKSYQAKVRLGVSTDTDDRTGQILGEFSGSLPDLATVNQALESFRGQIQQQPPAFSAIKKNGQPLYKLARRGQVVTPPLRSVTVLHLETTDFSLPFVGLEIISSAGTYIRSIARDLGTALGCGASLEELHRVQSGHWSIQQAIPLADITEQSLLPPEIVLTWLSHVAVTAAGYQRLQEGSPLPGEHEADEPLPLITYQDKIVAMIRCKEQRWWPRKVRILPPQTAKTS